MSVCMSVCMYVQCSPEYARLVNAQISLMCKCTLPPNATNIRHLSNNFMPLVRIEVNKTT